MRKIDYICDMRTGYIYKITSPTGRIYIGKSTNIKLRFRDYRGMRCKTQPKLYNSFLKHGVEAHTFEIIDECQETNLSDLEIDYIAKFNCMLDGLNCTKGGDGGFMTGDDNVSRRPDIRAKVSKSRIEYYKNNTHVLKGTTLSDETKDKIKVKRAEQENSGKAIRHHLVIDTQTGIFYKSIKEASEALDQDYKSFFYQMSKPNSRFISLKQSKQSKGFKKPKDGVIVLDTQTGIFYDNATLAANAYKIPRTTFMRKLKKGDDRFVVA